MPTGSLGRIARRCPPFRRRWSATILFLLIVVVPHSAAHAQDSAHPLMIWNFERSLVNPLGGEYNVFQSGPSWARTYLDATARGGKAGHSLRITAHREAQGFCGVWFDFYSQTQIPQRYVDASGYRYLRFWVKGEKGGEDFDVTLKDDTWRKHEDTNPTRPLHAYLPKGATTEWQEALIPLRDFKGLDSRKLFNLVFLFAKEGDYRLEVDDISFTNGPGEQAGAGAAGDSPATAPSTAKDTRGLWVWNTAKLLDPAHQDELERFLQFCSSQGVHDVFLSLGIREQDRNGAPHFDLKDPEGYRAFLERAHKAGLEVEALAGTPEWAAAAHHAQALAAIDTVIEFDRAAPATARFDGVHFDVEPYSLVGYADPAFRPQLLEEFLGMVAKCVARTRTAPGLRFSCDVPAWFYPGDELTREELTVDFNGADKTVGEHLTDLLDTVTIMDYRNEADGARGIILSGMPALEYAAARGKKIQVGLETSIEADRTIYFACGLPLEEFQKRLAKSDLRDELYFGDYRLSTFSDDINVHLGLAAPEKMDGDARTEFEKALAKLALELGASSDPEHFPPDEILDEARGALGRDPELHAFEVFKFADPATGRDIIGFKAVRHMSPKITFHGLGREVFGEEIRSVVEWLSPYASFQGLAIHYYESYRDLVEGP
jgi:Carbohydrate binding domain 30